MNFQIIKLKTKIVNNEMLFTVHTKHSLRYSLDEKVAWKLKGFKLVI